MFAPGIGAAIGAGLGGLFGLFGGGDEESPRERLARERAKMQREEADRISALSERQRREADAFSARVESNRNYQAGQTGVRANAEATGLYGKALASQRRVLGTAARAAASGANVNVNPALTDTFENIDSAGGQIEMARGQQLGQNEETALKGQQLAISQRQNADELDYKAQNYRRQADMMEMEGADPYTQTANQIAEAGLIAGLGKSIGDIGQGFKLGGGVVGGSPQAPQANAPLTQLVTQNAYEPQDPFNSDILSQYVGTNATRFRNDRTPMPNEGMPNSRFGMGNSDPYVRYPSDYSYLLTPKRRALGGRVEAGQPYVVGDSPDGMPTGNEELFVPEQDGTIVPSQNTRGRLGGADYLKAIKEELDIIRRSDEDLAYKMVEGTGLEFVLGRRNRNKSLQMS
jgi:hypothetical protein